MKRRRIGSVASSIVWARIDAEVAAEARMVASLTNTSLAALLEESLRRQVDIVCAAHPRVLRAIDGFRGKAKP